MSLFHRVLRQSESQSRSMIIPQYVFLEEKNTVRVKYIYFHKQKGFDITSLKSEMNYSCTKEVVVSS